MDDQKISSTSSPIMRWIRIIMGGIFLCFLIIFTLFLYSPVPKPSHTVEEQNDVFITSFAGDIVTLSPQAPDAIHDAPWDDFGDDIARLASEALLPLLNPKGTSFFIAPRPGTNPPLRLPTCDPFRPQPCDGVWIECPSIYDSRENNLLKEENIKQWATCLNPRGIFICDLDARGRSVDSIQNYLTLLSNHFTFLSLWSTGTQRWQLIASNSPLVLDPSEVETRFYKQDIFPFFETHAITSPWSLFASLISTECSTLTALPPSPQKGALGLIETFLPAYLPTLSIFSTPPAENTARAYRQAFYHGEDLSIYPRSQDPLFLSLASMDYALAHDYVQHRNDAEALRLCLKIQQQATPSVDQAIFTLLLAHRCKDLDTVDQILQHLATIQPQHVNYPEAFRAQYKMLSMLHRHEACLALLQTLKADTSTFPLEEQCYYRCEAYFLAAQYTPSIEHLKTLNEFLRREASEPLRTAMFSRYAELLKQYGDARTPLRFLSTYTAQQTWPKFETFFIEETP